MKIIYDHHIFNLQKYGGISRYFFEIITRIAQKKQIDIVPFMGFHVNEYGLERCKDRYSNFMGYKRPAILERKKFFLPLGNFLFEKFIKRNVPDIYHATFYNDFAPNYQGMRVLTVHDMIVEKFPQYFPESDRISKRQAVEKAHKIICVSQSTKRDLIDILGTSEEKIKVIYHGNSLAIDVMSPPIVKNPFILYVGLRGGYKNFALVLSAFAQSSKINNDFKLVCFGGGKFTKEEQIMLKRFGLADKVMLLSGTDETLANLYKYATIFVYPSQYEGFGIPPLEAMHYGCPVLTSNTSSIPEVVGNAGLYFDPNNMEELRDKMEILLYNDILRKQLIQLGYQQEQKFNWDTCAEETAEFYKSTLGDK